MFPALWQKRHPNLNAPRHSRSLTGVHRLNAQKSFVPCKFVPAPNLDVTSNDPPAYLTMDEALLKQMELAHDLVSRFAQFDDLASFKTLIIVDESHHFHARVKDAIVTAAWSLMALLKAYSADTLLFFMSHINASPTVLSKDELSDLKWLNNLLTYEGAGALIDEVLGHVGFRHAGLLRSLKGTMETLQEDQSLTQDQRFERCLETIRNAKHSLSPGWGQRNMSLEKFTQLYKEAHRASESEEGKLNHLGFTINQAITRAKKDYDAARKEHRHPKPTKVIILTGSELTKTAHDSISENLKGVQGPASEFSISVAYFGNNNTTSPENKSRNGSLDNQNRTSKDIFDAVFLDASMILSNAVGAETFVKLLYSHVPAVDRRKLPDGAWYGATRIERGINGEVSLPSHEQIRSRLNINLNVTSGMIGDMGGPDKQTTAGATLPL